MPDVADQMKGSYLRKLPFVYFNIPKEKNKKLFVILKLINEIFSCMRLRYL